MEVGALLFFFIILILLLLGYALLYTAWHDSYNTRGDYVFFILCGVCYALMGILAIMIIFDV